MFELASTCESFMNYQMQCQLSFLFQKLTVDEQTLLQKQDHDILKKCERYGKGESENFDIDKKNLEDSESESRYAFLYSFRISEIVQASKRPPADWLSDHRTLCNQQNSLRSLKQNPKQPKRKRF